MPKVPPAILFDMDDTLISFNGVGGRAWEICCRKFIEAHDFQIPLDTLMEQIKKTGEWYWDDPDRHKKGRADLPKARREMVGIALRELDVRDVSLSNELADAYSRCRTELIYVFPSSKATLETLVGQGVRLGLITNGTSAEQRQKIDRFSLEKYFEIILIEGEIGFGKPDLRVYETALSRMKLNPRDVRMVGDNLVWDVQAPQKLGIFSIWNDYKREGLPERSEVVPDRIIQDVAELIQPDE